MQTLITHMREKASVSRLCPLLGVSRSGFYAARSRLSTPRALSMQETQLQWAQVWPAPAWAVVPVAEVVQWGLAWQFPPDCRDGLTVLNAPWSCFGFSGLAPQPRSSPGCRVTP